MTKKTDRRSLKTQSAIKKAFEVRMLESYGVIHREVYPVVPPKVEYSLTDMGKDFLPILNSINKWAEKYTAD